MRAGRWNTSTRSPISIASLIWWVMNIAVLLFCRTSRMNSTRRSRAVISSSEEKGSSHSKISGSTAKAGDVDIAVGGHRSRAFLAEESCATDGAVKGKGYGIDYK